MKPKNILPVKTRAAFRAWLKEHHGSEAECWAAVKRGKAPPDGSLPYLDAVEEALCFGWIDSTVKTVGGVVLQRFTPRAARSAWSELNKERCRRLEKLGLMTAAGRAALPDMSPGGFAVDGDVERAFRANPEAWDNFRRFPALYQRVRVDTVQRQKKDTAVFARRMRKLIEQSAQGKMFGEWNDNGRLVGY